MYYVIPVERIKFLTAFFRLFYFLILATGNFQYKIIILLHPHDRRSMTHTTPKPWLIHQTFGMYPTT